MKMKISLFGRPLTSWPTAYGPFVRWQPIRHRRGRTFGEAIKILSSHVLWKWHISDFIMINVGYRGCRARGSHGLPKVSPGPTMPYPFTPCRRATTDPALQPFQKWPTHRAGGVQPFSTPLDTLHHTPMFVIHMIAAILVPAWYLGQVVAGGSVAPGRPPPLAAVFARELVFEALPGLARLAIPAAQNVALALGHDFLFTCSKSIIRDFPYQSPHNKYCSSLPCGWAPPNSLSEWAGGGHYKGIFRTATGSYFLTVIRT
jgi:hypothetical protein